MSFNYKTMFAMQLELMFKTNNTITGLTSLSVSITTEATLISLGYTLYRFKANMENYKSYEEINSHFIHFQGQKVQSQRKQKTVREIVHSTFRGNFVISHDTVLRLS